MALNRTRARLRRHGAPPAPRRRLAASRARLLGALVVLAGAGLGGWLWLRDSSLVAVEKVTVQGLSGPGAAQVAEALEDAGRDMTTLNLDVGRLRAAVASYPEVASVTAEAHPLHRLTIRVRERTPVAALSVGGARTPVASDGTLLRGRVAAAGLPTVAAPALPAGGRVDTGRAAAAVRVLAAAPVAMRRHVASVGFGGDGLEASLRDGPRVLLGDPDRARAKWIAAARVLNDPGSEGATYVDVRLPERPVAGGFSSTQG